MNFTTKTMLALSAGMLAIAPATAQSSEPARANSYSGSLTALNDSGVSGTFMIEQKGQGQIRVMINATGLEVTDQPHVAHIHGLSGNQDAMCPTVQADVNGDNDGFVELAEGIPTYGDVLIPLGDVDPDNDGVVDYEKTFNLNKASTFNAEYDKNDVLPLELREIVIHGLTLMDGDGTSPGEADGTAGYKVVLPVACGSIERDARKNDSLEFRTQK